MRVFAIGVEHALSVTVKRLQGAEHDRLGKTQGPGHDATPHLNRDSSWGTANRSDAKKPRTTPGLLS